MVHVRQDVGVGIQREGGAGVSELLRHHLWRNSDRKGKRRGCVAEIVKPDIRQTSVSQKWFEMLFNQVLLPVDWRAMSRSENQIGERLGSARKQFHRLGEMV